MKDNFVKISFSAIGENVALSRIALSSFLAGYDLPLSSLDELKIALSEAVSNAIIHGYDEDPSQIVTVEFLLNDDLLSLKIIDDGAGIADIKKAMEPAFSSKSEHMGLGFVFMDSFTDKLTVTSTLGHGTTVQMQRSLKEYPTCTAV